MANRLFLALPLPEKYLEVLANYPEDFLGKGINWTARENLHVTMFFLGRVGEERIEELKIRLEESFEDFPCFILQPNKILLAPPGGLPRMIWLIFRENGLFQELAAKISNIAGNFVFVPASAKPLPHATLARFKDCFNPSRLSLRQVELPELKAEKIQLVDSRLTSNGPIYTALKEFDLRV